MAVGAVVDASINAYTQYQDTGHINWGEVGEHAVQGALIAGAPFVALAATPVVMSETGNSLSLAGANTNSTGLFNAGQSLNNVSSNVAAFLNSPISLPDSALVCRGGTCLASQFAGGTGVTVEADGTMSGVSVSSASNKTIENLSSPYLNNQVGVTTAGQIRAAGGQITSSPIGNPYNPYHASIDGLTAQQLEGLFTPTIRNPYITFINMPR